MSKPNQRKHRNDLPFMHAAVFGPKSKFAVTVDESYYGEPDPNQRVWLPVLACKNGGDSAHIYVHSKTHLAFTGEGMRLRLKLLNAGAKSHQTGDDEFSVTFPASAFKQIAKIVRPHKQRGPAKAPSTVVNPGFKGGKTTLGAPNDALGGSVVGVGP